MVMVGCYFLSVVDPEEKDSFDVNPEKEFICCDGLPMVSI